MFFCLALAAALLNPLDDLANRAGTDKGPLFHHYTEIYSEEFKPFQDQPIKFLEIGIQKGYSVKMWEQYFPKADLYFIDITDSAIEYASTRSHYYFLDQSNLHDLTTFIQTTGGGFDIIIDDGGHTMQQQITSFKALFPCLNSGGIYVIEDLHTSYWREYGGQGNLSNPKPNKRSTTEFLKDLVDPLNLIAAKTACADQSKAPKNIEDSLAPYEKEIKGIYFASGICFIYKR